MRRRQSGWKDRTGYQFIVWFGNDPEFVECLDAPENVAAGSCIAIDIEDRDEHYVIGRSAPRSPT